MAIGGRKRLPLFLTVLVCALAVVPSDGRVLDGDAGTIGPALACPTAARSLSPAKKSLGAGRAAGPLG